MPFGTNFFNKLQREDDMKLLQEVDVRINFASKLHLLPNSDLTSILRLWEKVNPELVSRYLTQAQGYIKDLQVATRDWVPELDIRILSLPDLLLEKEKLQPNGKTKTRKLFPDDVRQRVYLAYQASAILYTAHYWWSYWQLGKVYVKLAGDNLHPSQYRELSQTARYSVQNQKSKIAEYLHKHAKTITP